MPSPRAPDSKRRRGPFELADELLAAAENSANPAALIAAARALLAEAASRTAERADESEAGAKAG